MFHVIQITCTFAFKWSCPHVTGNEFFIFSNIHAICKLVILCELCYIKGNNYINQYIVEM